jgi:hypothetical protein
MYCGTCDRHAVGCWCFEARPPELLSQDLAEEGDRVCMLATWVNDLGASASMICFFCHKPLRAADMAHRYEWRTGPWTRDIRIYGDGAPNGKLADATGRILKVFHGKCYHAAKKQQDLADARAADPEFQSPQDTDWRHQEIVELEDLAGEGHGGNRGAGEARC